MYEHVLRPRFHVRRKAEPFVQALLNVWSACHIFKIPNKKSEFFKGFRVLALGFVAQMRQTQGLKALITLGKLRTLALVC